jgi:hypothetical protein
MRYLGYPGGLTEGTYCMNSEKMAQLMPTSVKFHPTSVSLKEPSIEIDSFSSAKFEKYTYTNYTVKKVTNFPVFSKPFFTV